MSNAEAMFTDPHSSGFFVGEDHEGLLLSAEETAQEFVEAEPISIQAKRDLEELRGDMEVDPFELYRSLSAEYVDLVGRRISQDSMDAPQSLDLARRLKNVRKEFGAMDDLLEKSNLARDKEQRLIRATGLLLTQCMRDNPYATYAIGKNVYSFQETPLPQVLSPISRWDQIAEMRGASVVAFLVQTTILPEGTRYATGFECAELIFSLAVEYQSR